MSQNNVALLIDWENIKASTINHLATPPDIITLKKIARRYGSLRIARAYANWTDATGWHTGDVERLNAQGVDPVFVCTRHFENSGSQHDRSPSYEKDMVDLRIACDGMELLAMHPEITCFVLASGDGALGVLLTKLSAKGKHVVRIAVKQSMAKAMAALGEERVLYDDWVTGYRPGQANAKVNKAITKLTEALGHLGGESVGLNSLKDAMRGSDPAFEEEHLGIPTFRHLAFLAELRGLIRIDATKEPATASLDAIAKDSLPSGEIWRKLISSLDAKMEYQPAGIKESLKQRLHMDEKTIDWLISLGVQSDIIIRGTKRQIGVDRGQRQNGVDPGPQVLKEYYPASFRLNPHHPRVQVMHGVK